MEQKEYKSGECIIRYGDLGTHYFVLSSGKVKVKVYKRGTDPKSESLEDHIEITKEMPQGCGFGELALLYNEPRSATIEAIEVCKAYALDGTVFKAVVVHSSIEKRKKLVEFLEGSKLFSNLDKFQKLNIVDGLKEVQAKKDQVLAQG